MTAIALEPHPDSLLIPRPFFIAVDGTAASGKGTLAKNLAPHFGLKHYDNGLLFRVVTVVLIECYNGCVTNEHLALSAAEHIVEERWENHPLLRSPRVDEMVPKIGRMPRVREVITKHQKERIAASKTGVVIDGRATGREIVPQAQVKFYIDAAFDERVNRSFADPKRDKEKVTREDVARKIHMRDLEDRIREHFPLMQTDDAIAINTTGISAEEVLTIAIRKALDRARGIS